MRTPPVCSRLSPVAREEASAGSSVLRALRVVDAVAAAGDGVTAKAIARRLGSPLPTIYRVLATLVEEGYLVRMQDVRGYGLGYRVAALHRVLTAQVAPHPAVVAILQELHSEARAAAYLATFRDVDVVISHVEQCGAHPGPGLRAGEPVPAHATAGGKVLLASLDPSRLTVVVAHGGLERSTRRTLSERRALDRELMRIRSAGAAVEVEEHERGVAGIAVPVRGPGGDTAAAIGVVVARSDFAARRWDLEDAVRVAAVRASRALVVAPGAAHAP
ncbi:MAG: IclR family transcriptional regulator [Pseudonocardia sp. SCN 73-27]|nr:MAG: IclR family transcriptional regulator [Pseudonocardia sp. SCN 72-51]ODV03217.1 MAG: IclR family transcriptional regulator [Pseudonocardia sp. SCN 73-27]